MFQHFKNSTIRNAVAAFGTLFNNIFINRIDDDGNIIQNIKVPLSYAPRQKFIAKIKASPESFEQEYQSVLPRMSFEMLDIQYDSTRKVSPVQRIKSQDVSNPDRMISQYAPSPWNMPISLYIYGKNQEDVLQIVEQIIPYFNPDYNLNFSSLPALNLKDDLPIILNSISPADFYEGDFGERRMIIWTLNFNIKLNFYGPINKQGVIKRTITNIYTDKEMTANLERHIAYVDPITANVNDSYQVIDYFEDF